MTTCLAPALLCLFGTGAMLHHEKCDLNYDGTAKFRGGLDITSPQVLQTLGDLHILLRDPACAHGMTGYVETNVGGVAGFVSAGYGGFNIMGFGALAGRAIQLIGNAGAGSSTTPVVLVEAYKKSGTGRTGIADTELAFGVNAGDSSKQFSVLGSGRAQIKDGSTNAAYVATAVVSSSAASGDYPEGTFWAKV